MRPLLASSIAVALWAGSGLGWAAGDANIYACTDAKGRHLTSDRPIIECIDREQQVIGPTGQVVRKLGPSLTADEFRAEEEKQRKVREELQRQMDEKRRDRALVTRYPDRATHDRERQKALDVVDGVIATAQTHLAELHAQRRKLDTELEFYGNDLAKAPPALRNQFIGNDRDVAAQEHFIANQEDEKRRINANFDEELSRLNVLWSTAASTATPTPVKVAAPSRSSSSTVRSPAADSPSGGSPSSPAPPGH